MSKGINLTREQRRQRMIRRLNVALIVAWGLVLIGCIALWAIG